MRTGQAERGHRGFCVIPAMVFFFFFMAVLSRNPLFSEGKTVPSPYPYIESLGLDDPVFQQALDSINRYYRAEQSYKTHPPLHLFSYIPGQDDTIFSVSARFNLPYDTIALLNGIRTPKDFHDPAYILIPTQAGIFIPERSENDLERVMTSWRGKEVFGGRKITVKTPSGTRSLFFFPGERFHPIERSFFLNVLFRFPLPVGIVSSGYGNRLNPFSHEEHFHHGIDIAAPSGTEVLSAAAGKVVDSGTDNVLGNYIVLLHKGNFSTVYGHLREIRIKAGQNIGSGAIIGTVGNTGLSTGPHLHFEIRNAGESWNPSEILPQ